MRLFIDPGHGGTDPGAVDRIKEKDYTFSFAMELGRVLQSLGIEIAYSRTSDSDVSLSTRCNMANTWGADYFISIHFNAGKGTGLETYAFAAGGKAEKLAYSVQYNLIKETAMVNRGVKFANYQVLRDTSMPAILIEGGFVDSDDADLIKTEDYKRKFVRGVSKGICEYLGFVWKDPYQVVAPAVAPVDKHEQAIELLDQVITLLKG